MDINNESLQDIGAKEGAKAIQAKALGLPQMAQKHSELSKKAFTEFRKGREEKEEKEASKTEKGEAATKLRSIRAKIREHLDTYNISEECKQSILELFDRPSLGSHVYNAVLGRNLHDDIRTVVKKGAKKGVEAVKNKVQSRQQRLDNARAYLSAKQARTKAAEKTDQAYNRYEYARKNKTVPQSDLVLARQNYKDSTANLNQANTDVKKARAQALAAKKSAIHASFVELDNSFSNLNSLFENINTAIGGMMDVQPINLAGKPHPSCKQKKAQLNYKYKKLRRKEV